ncbi:MAG: hypothetical protein ACI8QF_004094, partial [Limisphaerales bacterium]
KESRVDSGALNSVGPETSNEPIWTGIPGSIR